MDYGVMAATFVNLETRRAVRITAREEARELSKNYCPEILDKKNRQIEAYKIMPEEELYKVEEVQVTIPEQDMPGAAISRVKCAECGDWIQNRREVDCQGKVICPACDKGRYYERI